RPVVNSVGGSEHYLATINPGSVTQQGDSPVVGFNLADFIITALDQSTRTYGNWGIEHDKLVLRQTGGAVTFNKAGSTRFRFPFAETGVTLVDSIGLSFFLPNAEDVTGTVTNYKAIHFPALTGGGGTNFYGLYFENAPNGGSIASKPGTDITIVAGSGGSTNSNIIASSTNFTVNTSLAGETGTVILNGGGASGVVQIKTNGLEIMRFGTVGASQNYLRVDANNTPLLMSQGPGAGVGLNLSSKGTSAIQFFTNGWNQEQFRVTHTASAVNYMTATGGAVGTGVTLSANGSDTDINLLLAPKGAGSVGIGVTSPTSLLQVATSTNNATTSVEIGKTGQNKGSCLVLYDATGAVQYVTIQGGAFVISPTSCK
ncbi:MAG: hypothetical protein Q8Q13_03415, partial [bacterium]|nr:hypothetical protein [bacterium]